MYIRGLYISLYQFKEFLGVGLETITKKFSNERFEDIQIAKGIPIKATLDRLINSYNDFIPNIDCIIISNHIDVFDVDEMMI